MEIIARLTANAVVKTTRNERQVVNFSVAINDSYKQKGSSEVTRIVTYVDCSYWGHSGIAAFLTKGTMVELYGRIGVNAYVNGQGEAKANLRFHVNNIKLHGGGRNTLNPAASQNQQANRNAAELTEPLDDLPF